LLLPSFGFVGKFYSALRGCRLKLKKHQKMMLLCTMARSMLLVAKDPSSENQDVLPSSTKKNPNRGRGGVCLDYEHPGER
jgi:hypothetical protein